MRRCRLRQQAGAIAEKVFARNPKHPGAAHYILHAYDHGALAAKALPAARAYAKIAPAASHALHMPAHAFLQLGLWDEAAASDRSVVERVDRWAKRRGAVDREPRFPQPVLAAIRVDAARAILEDARRRWRWSTRRCELGLKPSGPSPSIGRASATASSEIGRGSGQSALRNDRGSMRARYIIESERWHEMKGQTHLRQHRRAVRARPERGQSRGSPLACEAGDRRIPKASAPAQPAELREQAEVMLREMEALDLFAQGRQAEAFAMMDRAAALQGRMPKPIGRPFPVKDADELYGELLLEAGRPQEAIVWFERRWFARRIAAARSSAWPARERRPATPPAAARPTSSSCRTGGTRTRMCRS